MSGFGIQPAGTSSAGFGSPDELADAGGTILRDPQTGGSFGGRRIDPVKRDYVLDENGRLLGMNNVQQLVHLAIHTEKGSSAVRDLGQELRKLDRITSNFERRVLSVLTDALRRLIDLGFVEVVGFTSFKAGPKDGLQPGQTYGRLRWKDLTTGQEKTELI